jgi:hypothetical protein
MLKHKDSKRDVMSIADECCPLPDEGLLPMSLVSVPKFSPARISAGDPIPNGSNIGGDVERDVKKFSNGADLVLCTER